MNPCNKQRKILCLDDEPTVLNAMRRMLSFAWDIDTVTMPADAMVHLRNNKYDLFISDNDLGPKTIKGCVFIHLVKTMYDIPCILYTGDVVEESDSKIMPDNIVKKGDDLVRAVQDLI